MATPELTYLTVDSIQQGVGASQVLPYVERMAALGVRATVHSFEPEPAEARTLERLAASTGITWRPHAFGRQGAFGGAQRVVTGAAAVRGAPLLHARSDLAAAAALLAQSDRWLWDIRSFWIDQRLALGMTRRGSTSERVLRRIEASAARRSTAITTLTAAAIPELARRHGAAVADKASVVTTCVDLERFGREPMPNGPIRLLLSGSFNPLYDVDAMLRFTECVRVLRPEADLTLLRQEPTPWDGVVLGAGGKVSASTFAEMPAHVAEHHAGLSVCHTREPAALIAAMPTKIGEFLASGRPVVANSGLGDVDALLGGTGAGVVLRDTSDVELDRAAAQLVELVEDPSTPARCRAVAEANFDLDAGVRRLLEIYGSMA